MSQGKSKTMSIQIFVLVGGGGGVEGMYYGIVQVVNICLGSGSRQYCRYIKSPLGITPLKEILTSVRFEPATSE